MSSEYCLNCGTKLVGEYCHHCGQKDIPRRQVLSDLLSNFLEAFTNFDGKFLRTTKYLFLKPGFLSIEYNKGKRESYFHPVRMYTFASFLFFLLYVTLPDSNNDAVDAGLSQQDEVQLDSIKRKGVQFTLSEAEYNSVREYDSIQNTLPAEKRDGWWQRTKTRRGIELTEKYKDDKRGMDDKLSKIFHRQLLHRTFLPHAVLRFSSETTVCTPRLLLFGASRFHDLLLQLFLPRGGADDDLQSHTLC